MGAAACSFSSSHCLDLEKGETKQKRKRGQEGSRLSPDSSLLRSYVIEVGQKGDNDIKTHNTPFCISHFCKMHDVKMYPEVRSHYYQWGLVTGNSPIQSCPAAQECSGSQATVASRGKQVVMGDSAGKGRRAGDGSPRFCIGCLASTEAKVSM